MKLLRETIRRMILQEGMMMPDQLPEGVLVVIDYTIPGKVDIYYGKREGESVFEIHSGEDLFGSVEIYLKPIDYDYGPCDGAATVRETEAADGWGPLLYDVAIEVASSEASGLIADRRSVSQAAWHVWNTYMTKRDDVDHFQLDDPYDRLTPDWEDNCDQGVASEDGNAYDWQESPLSKVYIKNGTPMMDKLNALDKLVELYEET